MGSAEPLTPDRADALRTRRKRSGPTSRNSISRPGDDGGVENVGGAGTTGDPKVLRDPQTLISQNLLSLEYPIP